MNLIIVYILFIVAFFSNNLISLGVLPAFVAWITEPLIYLFFCISIIRAKDQVRFPFIGYFIMFFLLGLTSALANHNLSLKVVFGMRLVFRFYLFFLALVNSGISLPQLKKVNNLIIFIFLIQFPVSIVKLFIYGQGEQAVGTYAATDGAAPVVITLVGVGFAIAFYLYYKPSWKFILAGLIFISLSIIGKKRAIVFFFPLVTLFVLLTAVKDSATIKRNITHFRVKLIGLSLLMCVATFIGGIKFIDTLNPEKKIGGSFNLGYIMTYAREYTSQRNPLDKRYTGGRYSTTKQVLTVLYNKGISRMFFGYGPGAYTKSRFDDPRSRYQSPLIKDIFIQYGVTCLNFTAMEYGFLGVLIYLLFILALNLNLYKNWLLPWPPYWKAISYGTFLCGFIYFLVWVTYSPVIYLGDYFPLLFFFLFAQNLICRDILKDQEILQRYKTTYVGKSEEHFYK